MVRALRVLKARVVIPIHAFGPTTLAAFVGQMGEEFEIPNAESPSLMLSVGDLPSKPTILVMPEAGPQLVWQWARATGVLAPALEIRRVMEGQILEGKVWGQP